MLVSTFVLGIPHFVAVGLREHYQPLAFSGVRHRRRFLGGQRGGGGANLGRRRRRCRGRRGAVGASVAGGAGGRGLGSAAGYAYNERHYGRRNQQLVEAQTWNADTSHDSRVPPSIVRTMVGYPLGPPVKRLAGLSAY